MRVGVWTATALAAVTLLASGCGDGDNFEFCDGCPTSKPSVTPTPTAVTPTQTPESSANGVRAATPALPAPTPRAPGM
jgi:hypothetical protein